MALSKVQARFMDDAEGDSTDLDNLSPIAGLQDVDTVSLEEAVKKFLPTIEVREDDMESFVFAAKKKARLMLKKGPDPLNANEIAAINLYTQESPVYRTLNATLRNRDRKALKVWFPYLKLLLTAVHKLKPINTVVFRGVKLDLSQRYQKGDEVVWWSFSSATESIDVLEKSDFLGEDGPRTLFTIKVHNVINVQPYSAIAEDELLMLPGTQLIVKGVLNKQSGGLKIVQLEEDMTALSLIPGFGFAKSSSAVAVDGLTNDTQAVSVSSGVSGEKSSSTVAVAVAVVPLTNVQTKVFSNGDKYEGEMKDGKLHGRGTFFCASGNRYEGDWKDNKKHGQGEYFWAAGEWKGDRYEGEFKDGKKHGQGTYFTVNGHRYEGDWKDGKKHGQGTSVFANGNRYEGDWKDGKAHGQGTIFFADRNRYEGDWKDDKKHGQGTYFFANGDRYVGELKDDKKHGQGKTFNAQSHIVEQGRYENDKFVG